MLGAIDRGPDDQAVRQVNAFMGAAPVGAVEIAPVIAER